MTITELNQTEEKLLTELVQHPGWASLLKILHNNQTALLEMLYTTPDNNQHLINTWRALESVIRTCEHAKTFADVLHLGVENINER